MVDDVAVALGVAGRSVWDRSRRCHGVVTAMSLRCYHLPATTASYTSAVRMRAGQLEWCVDNLFIQDMSSLSVNALSYCDQTSCTIITGLLIIVWCNNYCCGLLL